MSDEAPQAAPKPDRRREMMLWAGLTFGVIVLLLLQSWACAVQRSRMMHDADRRLVAVAGLAARTQLQQRNAARLRRLAVALSETSGMSRVTFVDPQGNVLGSTDRTIENTRVAELASLPAEPRLDRVERRARWVVQVAEDGVVLGGIAVEFAGR